MYKQCKAIRFAAIYKGSITIPVVAFFPCFFDLSGTLVRPWFIVVVLHDCCRWCTEP